MLLFWLDPASLARRSELQCWHGAGPLGPEVLAWGKSVAGQGGRGHRGSVDPRATRERACGRPRERPTARVRYSLGGIARLRAPFPSDTYPRGCVRSQRRTRAICAYVRLGSGDCRTATAARESGKPSRANGSVIP